jgi:GNAT superfamily N-acetyltransferase
MDVRPADTTEIDHVGKLWFDAWQDAHAAILPVELVRLRTLESFRERIHAALETVRVIGPRGAPMGFCMIKEDELYQLFVHAEARGASVAAALLADAEVQLRESGVKTAWLACAIGNERAAKFYEKHVWHRAGNMINRLDTPEGEFLLEVWRYEKALVT